MTTLTMRLPNVATIDGSPPKTDCQRAATGPKQSQTATTAQVKAAA